MCIGPSCAAITSIGAWTQDCCWCPVVSGIHSLDANRMLAVIVSCVINAWMSE